ncbi:MAG: thiamine-phosphate kinase [Desulfobacterales bacterium]|nr:thiamine-phosphate kinase [Desulfobacterales bacterium]
MQIKNIGGEFALIKRLSAIVSSNSKDILVGIGDDAAVLNIQDGNGRYLLATTDMLVENEHFNPAWSRPDQIGIKAVESNVSDIAAMGGWPAYMFISLALKPDTTLEWAESMYHGIAQACHRYHIITAGGDTTHGPVITVSITLLGWVFKKNICLRSQAKPGDLLAVTGPLGASAAGLQLLKNDLPVSPFLLEKHLTPTCRLKAAQKLAPIVNAMIDISDGLASEIHHICEQSSVGARVLAGKIPLHGDVIGAGKRLGLDPLDFALNGGEDYELLFTLPPGKAAQLNQTGLACHMIGEITPSGHKPMLITESGEEIPLIGGYNHFSP